VVLLTIVGFLMLISDYSGRSYVYLDADIFFQHILLRLAGEVPMALQPL
jgi:hypothetical protein